MVLAGRARDDHHVEARHEAHLGEVLERVIALESLREIGAEELVALELGIMV